MKERDNKVSFECSLRDEGWPVVVVYNRATGQIVVDARSLTQRQRNIIETQIAITLECTGEDTARKHARKIGDWLTGPANSVGPN